MTDRRIDGFFYGLFMDVEILHQCLVERQCQITSVNPRRAYVDNFALHIGHRATLVPTSGKRAYGMVLALTHGEFQELYSAPGLESYQPEAVLAHSLAGEVWPALCW